MPHEKTFGHGPNVIHVGWDSNHGTYAQVGVVHRSGDPLVDGLFATLDEADLTKLMSVLRRAQRRLRGTGPAPGAIPRCDPTTGVHSNPHRGCILR